MPSNWMSVDSNFPSFTGKEDPTQQIRMLHNYLFCLKEHLQYSMHNLTADNWNASALQSLTDDSKDQLSAQIAGLSIQLNQLRLQVDMLQGKVTDTGDLAQRITEQEKVSSELSASVNSIQSILDATIQMNADGSVTLGKDGQVLRLVGQVYINGVLLDQGGTDETA